MMSVLLTGTRRGTDMQRRREKAIGRGGQKLEARSPVNVPRKVDRHP